MLLLTAFEPFDGTGINSSLEALQTWHAQNAAAPVSIAILPVRYNDDFAICQKAVADRRPQAIIHFGQTSGALIEVERFAINSRWSTAHLEARVNKSDDAHLQLEPILPDGAAAYAATFPVEEAVRVMQHQKLPARDSAHAGTYLCNHIFYRSLHHAATIGPALPIAFVHLPRLPAQAGINGSAATPTLPLPTLVSAVDIIVQIAL